MTSPPQASRHAKALKQTLIWVIKIAVSAGLLYLLLSRVDLQRLWQVARTASLGWLATALLLYLVSALISAWRWGVLLEAQHIELPFVTVLNSFLVATFFNNFLPSNIGGDVVRIRDTSRAAGSKTLAATVVLLDRGLGLLGLVFVAAMGATIAAWHSEALGPIGPGLLWMMLAGGIALSAPLVLMPQSARLLLRPFERLHQEWVRQQIERLTIALGKFRAAPGALLRGFIGAILVQATIVGFYAAVARALLIPIPVAHLSMLVPLSFLVQMLPVSVNGFGVREATFSFYFAKLHLPLESALALSFIGAVLIMLFSTSGAVAYLLRRGHRADTAYLGSSS
ncbi:MAG: lysylphosphatidylglycerol synthase transmembrane domain-containing protein [Vicinamibacterales bacterium]